ncbi:MAG: hypothetical protein IH840_14740, partial [Candidatus Heimdallarchaeota archaeon]|nr:hypothetical protein [Candidatus Heimdallarchaeota archaeon]
MNKERMVSIYRPNKIFLVSSVLTYLAFLVDIVLFEVQPWSGASTSPHDLDVKKSIFIIQSTRFEESVGGPIYLLGPSGLGYLVLIALPLVSAAAALLSSQLNTHGRNSQKTKVGLGFTFFVLIDPIVILVLDAKMNHFNDETLTFPWLSSVDLSIS